MWWYFQSTGSWTLWVRALRQWRSSAAQLGSAGPSLGSTALLDSIAAIAIGGTALAGGIGGVERTLLGVLILTVLSNGLNQMGVESYTQTIIKGAVIIVAAIITMSSQRATLIK